MFGRVGGSSIPNGPSIGAAIGAAVGTKEMGLVVRSPQGSSSALLIVSHHLLRADHAAVVDHRGLELWVLLGRHI